MKHARRNYDEFSFEMPKEWREQTHVFAGPPLANGTTPTLVVSRAPAQPGESLEALVFRTIFEMSLRTRDFVLIDSRPTVVARRRALVARFRSTNDRGVATQTAFFVDDPSGDVISVTCSVLSAPDEVPESDAEWAPALERVVGSMLVADDGAPNLAPSIEIAPAPVPPATAVVEPAFFLMPGTRRR